MDQLCRVPLAQPADVVLASAGRWPKDINPYQPHKALDHASHSVWDGGTIVLATKCGEGFGHPRFCGVDDVWRPPHELLRGIREHSVLRG